MLTIIEAFFGGLWKEYSVWIIGALAALVIFGTAFGYFTYSQNQIKNLAAELAQVQIQNVILTTNLDTLQKDQATVKALADKLNDDLTNIRQQTQQSIQDIMSQDFSTKTIDTKKLKLKVNKDWKQLQDSLTK